MVRAPDGAAVVPSETPAAHGQRGPFGAIALACPSANAERHAQNVLIVDDVGSTIAWPPIGR